MDISQRQNMARQLHQGLLLLSQAEELNHDPRALKTNSIPRMDSKLSP